jgi:LacI family transcriptional regulator, galactose operon repressor
MGQRPTINDVARVAGVSKVTVSYVLNGHSTRVRISDATRERVLEASKELGYTPNAVARMMVTKKCSMLGVVFQHAQYFSVWSAFTNEVMLGICQGAVSLGYDLMLHTGSINDSRSEADSLNDGRVDGVLILRDKDDETLTELLRRSLPTVLFFTKSDDPKTWYVDVDNRAGGRIATEHLAELGHRRIGMICGTYSSTASNERLEGYRQVMSEKGIPVEEDLILSAPVIENAEADIDRYLLSPSRPSGVVCWTDDSAIYVLRAAAKLGIKVPEELSVVGFDSLPRCEHTVPPLTSVRQPVQEIARNATEILIARCNHEKPEKTQILLPVELDVRESTAPPKPGR